MEIVINKKTVTTTAPAVVYLLAIIVSQLLMTNEQLAILFQLLIGLICFILAYIQFKTNLIKQWILISILFSVLLSLSLLYNGNSQFYHILYIWGRVGGALLFFYSKIDEKTLKFLFYSISVVFILMAVVGVGANDVLLGASRNGINGMIIFYAMCCYISYDDSRKKTLPYSYAIIAFVISLWSEGRSGIIVTLSMIVFVLFYNYLFVKKGKYRTIVFSIILLLIAYWFSLKYFYVYINEILERFAARGFGSRRFDVWAEYLDSLKHNPLNIVFGSATNESSYQLMSLYSGNLHNAFLMLHSKFGLFGFVFVIYYILKSFIVFLRLKRVTYLFALLIIILRGLFDWIAFPGYYDFLFALLFMQAQSGERAMVKD